MSNEHSICETSESVKKWKWNFRYNDIININDSSFPMSESEISNKEKLIIEGNDAVALLQHTFL